MSSFLGLMNVKILQTLIGSEWFGKLLAIFKDFFFKYKSSHHLIFILNYWKKYSHDIHTIHSVLHSIHNSFQSFWIWYKSDIHQKYWPKNYILISSKQLTLSHTDGVFLMFSNTFSRWAFEAEFLQKWPLSCHIHIKSFLEQNTRYCGFVRCKFNMMDKLLHVFKSDKRVDFDLPEKFSSNSCCYLTVIQRIAVAP